MAADGEAIGRGDEQPEGREVVLHLVDRLGRIGRRWPVELRAPGQRRFALQLLVVRNLPDDRAHDVQDVERGHAWPRAADVEARVGQPQPICCRTDGKMEQKPLGLGPIVLHVRLEAGNERLPHLEIEQQRILAQLLRKETFGQSRHEHDLEGPATRLVRTADEDPPVAIGRRLLVERPQSLRENIAGFLERDRTDGAHRAQLAEHAQHACGSAQHARSQIAKPLEPLAPGRLRRPGRERLDDREGEVREVRQILTVALEASQLRRFRVLAQTLLPDPRFVALAQPA